MVVELKPTAVKTEDGKPKKDFSDFVPISVPTARKKKAAVGCCTVFAAVAVVAIALMVLGVAGYFATEALMKGSGKEAEIICKKDNCEDAYECGHLHGVQQCQDEDVSDRAEKVYEDWMDLVEGRNVQFREYIKKEDGVYTLEVVPLCDAKPTFILVDTNEDYSVVKAEIKEGQGYQCMLFDNADFVHEVQEELEEFEYDDDTEEYEIRVERITSAFFDFGSPVTSEERQLLTEQVNELCPDGTMRMYHMVKSDDTFRAQVGDLMNRWGITADDIFEYFADIYEALVEEDDRAVQELMGQYREIVGFLPTGSYSDVSQSGVGWSLNVNVNTWYSYFWGGTVREHSAVFTVDEGNLDQVVEDDAAVENAQL